MLGLLASELTATVSRVNAAASASLGEPSSGPLPAIVRILNGNLAALNQMESRLEELGGEVEQLQGSGRRRGGGAAAVGRAA